MGLLDEGIGQYLRIEVAVGEIAELSDHFRMGVLHPLYAQRRFVLY